MISLLQYFSLRYILKHPFRVFLSAMAVALGVALFTSSDTSNHSTEVAFQKANDRLKGNTQLQVARGQMVGVETDVMKKIDAVPGIHAAPVLQLSSTLPDFPKEGNLMILGLDLLRENEFRRWDVAQDDAPQMDKLSFAMRDTAIVTNSFAARHGLKLGGTFRIDTPSGAKPIAVGAIVSDTGPAQVFGGNIAIMPIQTAQKLFKSPNRFDRVEIIVTGVTGAGPTAVAGNGADLIDQAARRLREALGPDYKIGPPPEGNSFLDDAMSRIKALMGISVLALLVGIFIIYNSVSISVVERLKEIGTLRAMGATKAQIFGVILLEWSIIGCIGSAAGVAIGFILARSLIQLTNHEVNVVVPIVQIDEVLLAPRTAFGGFFLGIMTTLFAAYFPARAAMSVAPIEILRQGIYRLRMISGYKKLFWVGLALIALASLAWSGAIVFENIGLVSAFISFLGASLALPQVTFWLARASRPYLGKMFHLEAFLAADNISKYPQRTALTVVALGGALGMMIAASALVESFKARGERWMRSTFPFDCSINATDLANALYTNASFPEDLTDEINKIDGVSFTYGVRGAFQDFNGKTVMLLAPELEGYNRMQGEHGHEDFIPAADLPEMLAGRGVGVSENFAARHNVKKGDSIELATLHGPHKFRVLGTMEDYTWPQGTIFIDRSVYKQLWDDATLTYLNIKYKSGVDRNEMSHKLADSFKGRYNLFLYDVEALVKVGDDTLNQSLKLTNVQVFVAVLIGFLGIVNTLLISVFQRKREIGLLRSVGMTRGQIVRMVVIESVFLAIIAAILGIGLGLVGAKWPLAIHLYMLSGFFMPLAIPWNYVWLAFTSALVIGFVAAFIPARHASRVNILDAIGYE